MKKVICTIMSLMLTFTCYAAELDLTANVEDNGEFTVNSSFWGDYVSLKVLDEEGNVVYLGFEDNPSKETFSKTIDVGIDSGKYTVFARGSNENTVYQKSINLDGIRCTEFTTNAVNDTAEVGNEITAAAKVINLSGAAASISLTAAAFDETGKCLTIERNPKAVQTGVDEISVSIQVPENSDKVKFFLWDNEQRPITEVKRVAVRKIIYVSEDGSDSNAGTISMPMKTIQNALNAAAESEENVNIVLRGGTYYQTEPIVMNSTHSGTNILGYDGEEVKISGAVSIPAEKFSLVTSSDILDKLPDEAKGKVYSADLASMGLTNLPKPNQTHYSQTPNPVNDLIWEGETCTLARWPNNEYALTGSIISEGVIRWGNVNGQEGFIDYPDDPGITFETTSDRAEKWLNAKDAMLEGYWKYNWATDRLRIKSVSQNQITTDRSASFGVKEGAWYYIFNLIEELDAPGEWYIDHENNMLYVYPPTDIAKTTDIRLTYLEDTLLQISNASDIKIENITFEGGMGHFGGVSNCENVKIAGCEIRNFSGHGLDIIGGKNCGIASSDVHGLGAYAIRLSGGSRVTLEPCGHYSVNNRVYDYANIMKTYQAATACYGVGCRVAYNEFYDAPHYAIGFEGNDHIIEYNNIHDVLKESADAGAIYTLRDLVGNGTIVRYNYIHDLQGANSAGDTVGIYFDDGSSGCTAYGNVINRIGYGILCGGGRNVTLENNIIINSTGTTKRASIYFDRRTADTGWTSLQATLLANLSKVPYQNEYWQAKYPEVYNVAEDEPGEPKYNVVKNNVIYSHNAVNINQKVKDTGTVKDNLKLYLSPGFTDEANEQYSLKESSRVFNLLPEFKNIPFENIGLYSDNYRNDRGELR